MKVFAKFDEIPSMTLQDIKKTKRYRHTFVCSFVRTDNVKTVYPPTNTVCGGYNNLPGISIATLRSIVHEIKISKWAISWNIFLRNLVKCECEKISH